MTKSGLSSLDEAQEAKYVIDKLNACQVEFLSCPEKYVGLYGGIRNGKTWIACVKGIILSLQFPGNRGLVGRLTYNELRDTTQKEFLDFVKQLNGGTLDPGPIVKSWKDFPVNTLTFQNDSEVVFRYLADPTAILSMTLGWFYIDQAEYIPEGTYSTLEGRLSLWGPQRLKECKARYKALYGKPLDKLPTEYGFITGNPAPGWVHARYKLNPTGRYRLVEASTAANEENLPGDYLDSLKATNTEAWVQRFLEGSWDTFSGQIYKDFSKALHCVPNMVLPAHWPRFIGWDHGQVDPTAVVFVGVDEDGNRIVYKEHYKVSPHLSVHVDAVKALCIGDPVRRSEDGSGIVVYMDPSTSGRKNEHGRDFKMLYAEAGIYGINAENSIRAGILHIQQLMLPDQTHKFPAWHPRAGELGSPRLFFVDENLPALLHELSLYQWKPIPEGKEQNAKEEPVDYLNHALDALRYCLMAIFEQAEAPKKEVLPTYADWVKQKEFGGPAVADGDDSLW